MKMSKAKRKAFREHGWLYLDAHRGMPRFECTECGAVVTAYHTSTCYILNSCRGCFLTEMSQAASTIDGRASVDWRPRAQA